MVAAPVALGLAGCDGGAVKKAKVHYSESEDRAEPIDPSSSGVRIQAVGDPPMLPIETSGFTAKFVCKDSAVSFAIDVAKAGDKLSVPGITVLTDYDPAKAFRAMIHADTKGFTVNLVRSGASIKAYAWDTSKLRAECLANEKIILPGGPVAVTPLTPSTDTPAPNPGSSGELNLTATVAADDSSCSISFASTNAAAGTLFDAPGVVGRGSLGKKYPLKFSLDAGPLNAMISDGKSTGKLVFDLAPYKSKSACIAGGQSGPTTPTGGTDPMTPAPTTPFTTTPNPLFVAAAKSIRAALNQKDPIAPISAEEIAIHDALKKTLLENPTKLRWEENEGEFKSKVLGGQACVTALVVARYVGNADKTIENWLGASIDCSKTPWQLVYAMAAACSGPDLSKAAGDSPYNYFCNEASNEYFPRIGSNSQFCTSAFFGYRKMAPANGAFSEFLKAVAQSGKLENAPKAALLADPNCAQVVK